MGKDIFCYVDCYDRYMFWIRLAEHCHINIKAFVYDSYTPIRLLGFLNQKIQKISNTQENSILLVWNNCTKHMSRNFNEILYFEVCNLGSYVYFDNLGVNCDASFIAKQDISSEIDEHGYYTLKDDAIKFFQWLDQKTPPESYPNPRKRYVVQKLLNITNFKNLKKLKSLPRLFRNWYLKRKMITIYPKKELNNKNVILILQTRNDTSLIQGWSSDYDTLIHDLLRKYNHIYVRPHPEDLVLALDLVRKWPDRVKISFGNFNELFGQKYLFYTVCSSAGLKLCLKGEEVKFLGAAYFMIANRGVKELSRQVIL